MSAFALAGGRLFTGAEFLDGHAIVVEGAKIAEVVAEDRIRGLRVVDIGGLLAAPGFLDLQVNGGGDVLFNDRPTEDAIRRIVAAHRRLGTTDLLPTFITGPDDARRAAVAAVRSLIAQGEPGVAGIHLEGPHLNPAAPGVHDPSLMRPLASSDDLDAIPSLGPDHATLLTVAPERCQPAALTELARRGVTLAAGHSIATYEQTVDALRYGLTGATHLFNAMGPMTGRAPGLVGAVLAHPELWCGVIVDGHHVAYGSVKAVWQAKRPRGMFLVSDAMPPVGGTRSEFRLGDRPVRVTGEGCTMEDGTLAGAALDLATAVRNCVNHAGIPLETALRMASTDPAEFAGLGGRLGRLASGHDASIVLLDGALQPRATVVAGELRWTDEDQL